MLFDPSPRVARAALDNLRQCRPSLDPVELRTALFEGSYAKGSRVTLLSAFEFVPLFDQLQAHLDATRDPDLCPIALKFLNTWSERLSPDLPTSDQRAQLRDALQAAALPEDIRAALARRFA